MKRYEPRISLFAIAISAFAALSIASGTAALFQSRTGISEPSIYATVASKPAVDALPMREIVPNRIEVIAVREPERLTSFFQRVTRRLGV